MNVPTDTAWPDTDRVEEQTSTRPDGSRVTTRRNLETGQTLITHIEEVNHGH